MKQSPMKSLKIIIAAVFLMSAFSVSATPFSPSWMKTSIGPKGNGAVNPPGELGDGGNGLPRSGPLALPLPGTAWLFAIGLVGVITSRRK
ncbi:MAG: hypothetical protein ABIP64_06985 [Burkholderiales bacterium]